MDELKRILFIAAELEQNALAKAMAEDKYERLKAAYALRALCSVIEQAGLTEEYNEYMTE